MRKSILPILKILSFWLLSEFFLFYIDGQLSAQPLLRARVLLTYGAVLAAHLLVQFFCSRGAVFGSQQFWDWQIVCFVGIIAARLTGLFNGVDPNTAVINVLSGMQQALPGFLLFHGVIHLLYIVGSFVLFKKSLKKA